MAKPKSLLKGQELTPDNHHPNTPLEWGGTGDWYMFRNNRSWLKYW